MSYQENVLPLSLEATVYHASKVKVLHQFFAPFWKILFEAAHLTVPEADPAKIRQMGTGLLHLMGLLDLTLKLLDQGVSLVWVHPESALHPNLQAALADLLIALQEHYKFNETA